MSLQPQGDLSGPTDKTQIDLRPDAPQEVRNEYGGYVWELPDDRHLRRLLLLGTERCLYSVPNREVEESSIYDELLSCVRRIIESGHGTLVVDSIKRTSVRRENLRHELLLFALSVCARSDNSDTKTAAYEVFNDVCRTPTHLFTFVKFCEKLSSLERGTGWGRRHKKAISNWYHKFEDDPKKLAYLITKFRNRKKWSHTDVVRLAHPDPTQTEPCIGFLLSYIAKGYEAAMELYNAKGWLTDNRTKETKEYLLGYEEAKTCTSIERLAYLIRKLKLVREHLPSDMLNHREIFEAMLPHMPVEGMIRNLGKMTDLGLFPTNGANEELVVKKLRSIVSPQQTSSDDDTNSLCLVHPFRLFLALRCYELGRGEKGSLSWVPNQQILEALKETFEGSFSKVEPSEKNICLAIDVSSSMKEPFIESTFISCATAAGVMALVLKKTEPNCQVLVFSDKAEKIDIRKEFRLSQVVEAVTHNILSSAPSQSDCSSPIKFVMDQHSRKVEVFIILTDNLNAVGNVHPDEALRQYRTYSGKKDAKLVVCAMKSNDISIADPDDLDMLDIAGFNADVPYIISEFAKGNI